MTEFCQIWSHCATIASPTHLPTYLPTYLPIGSIFTTKEGRNQLRSTHMPDDIFVPTSRVGSHKDDDAYRIQTRLPTYPYRIHIHPPTYPYRIYIHPPTYPCRIQTYPYHSNQILLWKSHKCLTVIIFDFRVWFLSHKIANCLYLESLVRIAAY